MTDRRDIWVAQFDALSHPIRFQILEQLHEPLPLSRIRCTIPADDEPRSRPVSRQTIRQHLDRLIDADLVEIVATTGVRGPTKGYLIRHTMVYTLSEAIRRLASIRPEIVPDMQTFVVGEKTASGENDQPRLEIVKGLMEGKEIPLSSDVDGREWRIGRDLGCDVAIDYDAYVSAAHAQIHVEDGRFMIQDLPHNKNGTFLDGTKLSPGEWFGLRDRSLIRVGRTVLQFLEGQRPPVLQYSPA